MGNEHQADFSNMPSASMSGLDAELNAIQDEPAEDSQNEVADTVD
jgi:hypothetical protein